MFEALDDERAIEHALGRLGNLATAEGDHGRARGLLERSIEIRRRIKDWRGMTLAESNLGNLAAAEGDLETAAACWNGPPTRSVAAWIGGDTRQPSGTSRAWPWLGAIGPTLGGGSRRA